MCRTLEETMGYRISLLISLFLLFSLTSIFLSEQLFTVRADAGIIRVPSDFPTIQEAINTASSGATILVSSGVYLENVIINKTLMLLGAGKQDTIVDGSTDSQALTSAVGVTISADNVTVNGFTVRNRWSDTIGIRLDHSNGSIVSGNVITKGGHYGILLFHSCNNTVSDNIVSYTGTSPYADLFGEGIALWGSDNNTIQNNLVTDSYVDGLCLRDGSTNNIILGNTIENDGFGFTMETSGNNTVFRNNVLNFFAGPYMGSGPPNQNTWSIGGEGNYWGDYTGLDDGSNGRIAGDGIGDTGLPWHGVDDYPLTTPVNPIQIFWDNEAYPISLVCNSTLSAFTFAQSNKEISFVATGPANTTGYFNVSMPKMLLSGPWRILLSQSDATSKATIVENETHTTILLNYIHSSQNIELIGTQVIPEYPSPSSFLLAILLLSTAAVIFVKKRTMRANRNASRSLTT
jgi:parallel beta-helix repeat protein